MQPPITHYKDEQVDTSTERLVNQEMDAAAHAAKNASTTPELKVLPVEKSTKRRTASSSIVNAFRQKMASSATPVELPSIGRTVEFRDIPAAEQKDLSKIALQSNSRADIMYCAMLNLISKLAVEKSFDIRDYTEFERILVTLNLQQMNKINPEIKYTCPKCNRENSYTLDMPRLLRGFAKAYRPDANFEIESGGRRFTFTVGWPKVSSVEDFFKTYYRKYDSAGKAVKESMDNLAQVEYIAMFVKKVCVTELADEDDTLTADMEEMDYNERTQILDSIPQSIVFDETVGVIAKVIGEYIEPMNEIFRYRDCAFCGAPQDGQVANLSDFLGG